ncbi:RNA-directed DNA polymerase [Streptomyces sp. NPDC007044]
MRDEKPLQRDANAYLSFVQAPIDYAWSAGGSGFLTVGDSPVKHVVKSDITAFYQYIDHDILARELLARTGKHEAIRSLMEILQECQGRKFGIPQLLDASDVLSEAYADIIERDLLRQGFPTWRFNDDFRIACESYEHALDAIEALDRSSRSVGLTLGEHKTVTPTFFGYAFEVFGLSVSDLIPRPGEGEPEFTVMDYMEEALEEDVEEAESVLSNSGVSSNAAEDPPGWIDLRSASAADVRKIRRAINGISRGGSDAAIDRAQSLVTYLPSLTPTVTRYLISRFSAQPVRVSACIDSVLEHVFLSDWQKLWMAHAVRECKLLSGSSPGNHEGRRQLFTEIFYSDRSPVLRAEIGLALAQESHLEISALDAQFRRAPGVLGTWYLAAVAHLGPGNAGTAQARQFQAMRDSVDLAKFIL